MCRKILPGYKSTTGWSCRHKNTDTCVQVLTRGKQFSNSTKPEVYTLVELCGDKAIHSSCALPMALRFSTSSNKVFKLNIKLSYSCEKWRSMWARFLRLTACAAVNSGSFSREAGAQALRPSRILKESEEISVFCVANRSICLPSACGWRPELKGLMWVTITKILRPY